MAAFVPRTAAPSATDKHWVHVSRGGLNECILITGDSVLPNCVGYAWGRVYELLGKRPTLSRNNAENWYGYTADGYERSQTPKLGSVLCWRKGQAGNGSDGAGHVAVVEAIYSDGTVLCSNSAYKGQRFYMKRINPKTWPGGAYIFQGYTHPDYDYTTPPTERVGTTVERDTSKHQVEVLTNVLRARKRPELSDDVIVGFANPGLYNVLEERDMTAEASNGYLWYRIDTDMWIATKEGSWTKNYPAQAEPSPDPGDDRMAELEAENARLKAKEAELSQEITDLNAEVSRLLKIIQDAISVLTRA